MLNIFVLLMSGLLLTTMISAFTLKLNYPSFNLLSFEPILRFDCYIEYCAIRFDPRIVPTFGERNANIQVSEWINSNFGLRRLVHLGDFGIQAFLSTDGLTCGGVSLFGPGIELRIDKENNLARYIHDNDYRQLSIIPYCHS